MSEPSFRLCIHCGKIQKKQSIICTNCSLESSPPLSLLHFADDALSYGYRHRKIYELQISKYGAIRKMHSLPSADEMMVFLTLAALSGIVGNISADIFKAICRKIKKRLINQPANSEFEELLTILEEENKILEFYDYVQAYYYDMPNVDPKVITALREERLLHAMQSLMDEYPQLSPFHAMQIAKARPDNQNMHKKPSRDDIKTIFSQISQKSFPSDRVEDK